MVLAVNIDICILQIKKKVPDPPRISPSLRAETLEYQKALNDSQR